MPEILNAATDKFTAMTTQPVKPLLVRLAIPAIAIMMVSAMYNLADTFFVGFLGTSATAAVGVCFSLMTIIQAIGFFFGHGTGNYISRALGAQRSEDAEKVASTGFFTCLGVSGLLAGAGLFFMDPLAKLLGSTETILPYARSYLRFILIGMPFMVGALMLNNLLRFQGNAFWGMIGMTSGAALNIGLDPLFIFGFHLNVTGAALATMISQTLSCLLLFFICRTKKTRTVRIAFSNFAASRRRYKEIARGGLPSLLRQGLMSLSTLILNHAAGPYGDAVIAAVSIVNRVFLIAASAILGLGQGFQPVCGFNYGARLYRRVKEAFFFCLRISTFLLVLAAALLFALAPGIIALFRPDDPVVIRTGTFALRLYCCVLPLMGWTVLNQMMLQTMGKALAASILAAAKQGLFLIPLLLILPPLFEVRGILFCSPLAEACTFLFSLPLGIGVLTRDLKTN
ncbi:MAG: MATE family efflux transporter [Spirochaetales bacterium]|jgi:putative MATE family efflux protein|nr:MATE family efflux transporter [Spirochaetales bacterium]